MGGSERLAPGAAPPGPGGALYGFFAAVLWHNKFSACLRRHA